MKNLLSKENIKKIFNKEFYKKVALVIFLSFIMYLYVPLNKLRYPLIIFKTPVDNYIPFLPFFVVFYFIIHNVLLYGTMAFSFIKENKRFYTFFYSMILANMVAYLIYYFFQSTIIRPTIVGHSIFSLGVAKIYSTDLLYNAFPSGHAYYSTIVLMHWLKSNARKSIKIIISVLISLVLMSTLFIKQHFILDIIAGITLGIFSYLLVFSLMNKKKQE